MGKSVDVKVFRAKLVAEGAVDFFDELTVADVIAKKAIRGFHWAMPGAGLYKEYDKHYYMRISSDGFAHKVDKPYFQYSADEWRVILQARDRRLLFARYRIQRMRAPYSGLHVIVHFVVAEDTDDGRT